MDLFKMAYIGTMEVFSRIYGSMCEASIEAEASFSIRLADSYETWMNKKGYDYDMIFIDSNRFGHQSSIDIGAALRPSTHARIIGTSMMLVHAYDWEKAGLEYVHTTNIHADFFRDVLFYRERKPNMYDLYLDAIVNRHFGN